ncbi:RdgB/HAM1 family non-canonical purine NTP pyrophosphatase [Rhabdochlamydiaceae symbiont of Dictyostelium giganteum]|uniref:RdgB/HAM1 family non-canonical purine NTP pyrophosphatase n=1 Tax=Rhabdochlamydiaceae symbiont of Dictyostelium giganteum TaxID=3342349 RepID=UPI00384F48EE
MQLIIASQNVHKIRELRSMLKIYPELDILSLIDFPSYTPPEEGSLSFEENVIQKAIHAAKTLGKWVLADDTGLVVPGLNGAPGVLSSRYAGEGSSDSDNRKKLLQEMQHLTEDDRQAYFECWLAIASPEGLQKCVKGVCEGLILPSGKGGKGFGYDSLFIKHEYGKTFAELEEDIKNRISHRRKALDKLHLTLELMTPPPHALLD